MDRGGPDTPTPRPALLSRLRHNEPETRMRDGGSGDEDVEVTCLPPLPPSEQRPDLLRGRDPGAPGQGKPRASRGRPAAAHGAARPPLLTAVLAPDADYEALPPPLPASVEDLPATARRHPGAKTMLVDPLTISRAIRRLHRNPFWIRRYSHGQKAQTAKYIPSVTARQ